jgi:hypothetical protein
VLTCATVDARSSARTVFDARHCFSSMLAASFCAIASLKDILYCGETSIEEQQEIVERAVHAVVSTVHFNTLHLNCRSLNLQSDFNLLKLHCHDINVLMKHQMCREQCCACK